MPFSVPDHFVRMQQNRSPHASDWNYAVALRLPGQAPPADAVHALVADALGRIPALSYRPVERRGRWHFEHCSSVDPSNHVEELVFPAGLGPQQCLRHGVQRPWIDGQPPWSLQIITGYRDDEHLLVYRVAHALQDGTASASTAHAILTGRHLPAPSFDPAAMRLRIRSLAGASRYLARLLVPHRPWLPESAQPHAGVWSDCTAALDRARISEIARCTGATTAQVLLAVICGALRAWTPGRWTGCRPRGRLRGVPTYLAVSLRTPRDRSCLGNRFGALPVFLPCNEPSATERLRRIQHMTRPDELAACRRHLSALLYPSSSVSRLLSHLLMWCERPRLAVTIVPWRLDMESLGAKELLMMPMRPARQDGGLVVIPQPTGVTVQCYFPPTVADTDRLPALFTQSLADLSAAVALQPIPSAKARAV
ncbi:hypothetical protein ACFVOK_38020 [Streptomyces sp. NPDC057798]|uniref:hypothetical protein n=1 Tax=Streptomyces sp. NPDC057798 TaxID=3346252 RepID=UPI0036C156C1